MATVKEFSALRFTNKAGSISELVCAPYDIISEEQRLAYINTNENNVIRLELPVGEDRYNEAGKILNNWLESGILECDSEDALYIYEEAFSVKGVNYSFKGFVSRVMLHEFSEGIVLPHEETLSKAKQDRFNLMTATGCNFSQIYSLYSDEKGEADKIIAKLSSGEPVHKFTDPDGVTHSLWIAKKSADTEALCRFFDDKKLYIADGHHRYETALNYKKSLKEQGIECDAANYIMMFLVSMQSSGLVVFPTHRIVRDLEKFDRETLLSACSEYFEVEKLGCEHCIEGKLDALYNDNKTAFGYVDKDSAYLLTLKDISVMDSVLPDKSKALSRLDVSVLHSLILERCLKIDKENMAKQINLTYTRDLDEAFLAAKNYANCCFILNPTRVSEIAAVATNDEKMPQKSTYFYPKLITGLVMNKIK